MISIYLIPDECLNCLAECAPKCEKLSDQARRDLIALIKDAQIYRLYRKGTVYSPEKPEG